MKIYPNVKRPGIGFRWYYIHDELGRLEWQIIDQTFDNWFVKRLDNETDTGIRTISKENTLGSLKNGEIFRF